MKHTFYLQVSSLGVTPFFVENVSALQLSALRLVTAVSYHKFACSHLYMHMKYMYAYSALITVGFF